MGIQNSGAAAISLALAAASLSPMGIQNLGAAVTGNVETGILTIPHGDSKPRTTKDRPHNQYLTIPHGDSKLAGTVGRVHDLSRLTIPHGDSKR